MTFLIAWALFACHFPGADLYCRADDGYQIWNRIHLVENENFSPAAVTRLAADHFTDCPTHQEFGLVLVGNRRLYEHMTAFRFLRTDDKHKPDYGAGEEVAFVHVIAGSVFCEVWDEAGPSWIVIRGRNEYERSVAGREVKFAGMH
jgi:hypothetical protein